MPLERERTKGQEQSRSWAGERSPDIMNGGRKAAERRALAAICRTAVFVASLYSALMNTGVATKAFINKRTEAGNGPLIMPDASFVPGSGVPRTSGMENKDELDENYLKTCICNKVMCIKLKKKHMETLENLGGFGRTEGIMRGMQAFKAATLAGTLGGVEVTPITG